MKTIRRFLLPAVITFSSCALLIAQGSGGANVAPGRGKGAPRPALSIFTTAWADGGEIPMKYASRGENKSPAFEFRWMLGTNPGTAPDELQTYAVIFHDIENSANRTTADTLHWTAFNIPGTAKGIAEGLGSGDLPDGTRNGPGNASRAGKPPAYDGPGAGPGRTHHYVFEFYALDTKLDLPATTTREDLFKAMEGHIVSKAAWVGRFPGPTQ